MSIFSGKPPLTPAARARQMLRRQQNSVLCTLSAEMEGWPFASIAPYVLDHAGEPWFLLSDIAQHSHNIHRDPRVSVLVREDDGAGDMQASGRATLMGRMQILEPSAAMRARFLRYQPQAKSYFQTHDFRFYHLQVERVRWIGGFGDIHWIAGNDYRFAMDAPALIAAEEGAVAHMNADHVDAMCRYARHFHALEIAAPKLLGIDPEGFDIDSEKGRLRFDFPQPVADAQSLRQAMVELSSLAV